MTREQRLIKQIVSANHWWLISTGATFGIGFGVFMGIHWLTLIAPLWLVFDTTACFTRRKIQLYTVRLLGKQNEPADNAEEDA